MSRILVDTHVALWALSEPERLTAVEAEAMVDRSVERCLSPVSVWEAAIKRESGKLGAPRNLATVMKANFTLLTIDARLLEEAAELPRHHGDPFDRVIIAHALRDDLPILTRDAQFASYGTRLIA